MRGIAQVGGSRACARGSRSRAAPFAARSRAPRPTDVVLVAGKGHEEYQLVGAERRAFSDAQHVRARAARVGSAHDPPLSQFAAACHGRLIGADREFNEVAID